MRVFLPSAAALTVLSLSALLTDSADAKLRLNGWFPCGFSASAPGAAPVAEAPSAEKLFECGEVDVPLCHEGVCESDRTIPIFVKRLMANATTTTTTTTPVKSLWMLQGGPGGSSVALETSMQAIQRQLNYTANVYTMDHRGTGRSFFLQCDAAQAFTSGSPSGVGLSPDELPDCLRDILFQIDNQTAAFSVTSAAKDMEYLVQELHGDHEEVYVYGASYGTYLTERLMHLAPPKVKGYVLDGVMAEDDPTFTTRNADNVVPSKRLATYCQEDPKCAAMFLDSKHGKDKKEDAVYAAWQKIYSDLDKLKQGANACADLFRFSTLGDAATEVSSTVKFSLSSYTIDPSLRVLLPGMLQLIHRCQDDNDLLAIQTIQKLVQSAGGGGNSAAIIAKAVKSHSRKLQDAPAPVAPTPQAVDVIGGMSTILMFLMKVSELWTFPSPSWSDEMETFEEGVFPQPMVADYTFHCLYSGNKSDPSCDVLDDAGRLYGADLTTVEPVRFAYDMDEYWGDFATIPDHASVLMINGKLDFQTMSDNGVRQFENMEGGEGKLLVEMDYGGHCTGIVPSTVDDKSECGYRIIASFVEQSGSVLDVDTSCLEELPTMTFFSGDMIIDTFLKSANGGDGGEMEAAGEDAETETEEEEEEEEETGVKKVAKMIKAKAKKTTTTKKSKANKSTKGFRLP